MKSSIRVLTLVSSVLLGGCASMQSHDETSTLVQKASAGNNFDAAITQLDARFKTADQKKDLLYSLERGELQRLAGKYQDSTATFLVADEHVKQWEAANTEGAKVAGQIGAALISDRLRTYEGYDYEKVWLTTRLALNHISMGDFDAARVDIKRTHERESVIARVRSKATAEAETEAQKKGAKAEVKEINGYPTATLNDPEVLSLKNGYQNALSHYLAGFLYEALNEPSLAAPGYRMAIELRPGSALLEEGLRGLDERTSDTWKQRQKMTDVLVLIETGVAPARVSKQFMLPVPLGTSTPIVPISYPIINPSTDAPIAQIDVDGNPTQCEKIVDLNVMARRELKDEMPGIILRNVTRAVAQGALQSELQKNAGVFGALAGVAFSAATAKADDRMWRMLPDRVYLARLRLAQGEHELTIGGVKIGKVQVAGQYELVPVRLYQGSVLIGEPGIVGQPGATVAAAPQS